MSYPTVPLGSVCHLVGGGTPSKAVSAFYGGNIPWATVRDMNVDVIARTESSITDEAVRSSTTNVLPAGTVVTATRVGLGKVCIVEQPTAINQDLRGLVPKNVGEIEPRFLFWWLKSVAHKIIAHGTGATVQGVKASFVASLAFPKISIAKQQSIVATLDEAFERIALATRFAETNKANAADLQRSCLEAELQRAAHGRDMAPLDSFCPEDRPITYGVVKLGEQVDGGTPCLRTSNVRWLAIEERGLKSISPTLSTEYRRTILRGGEVLVNVRGTLGGVAVVPSNMAGWNISREVAIVPNEPKRSSSEFLAFWIASQASQQWLTSMTTGAAYVGINIADLRKLPVPKLSVAEQEHVVERIQRVLHEQADLIRISERKLSCLEELKQSLLASAFSGELMADTEALNDNSFVTPEQAANILAFMYWRHERASRSRFFGHVMAQKSLDLVERVGRVELGRRPYKDAAGPNDKPHMTAAEAWAKQNQFFEFVERPGGGYDFRKLANHGAMLSAAKTALKPIEAELDRVANILVGKDKIQAEIFATVLAAWNNLIIDGKETTETAILREARDDWHADKANLAAAKFQEAIREIRRLNLVPDGSAKAVRHKQVALF